MIEFLATAFVVFVVAGLILQSIGGLVDHYHERWVGPGEQAKWTAELERRKQATADLIASNERATAEAKARYDAIIRQVYRA